MGGTRHIFRSIKQVRLLALAVGVLAGAQIASAQYREDHIPDGPPVNIPAPGITDKHDAAIPRDLTFTRSDGQKTTLGDIFSHGRPVIIVMVYFSCPNLCGYVQEDLVQAIRNGPRSLQLGKDYDVVLVSIDPDDTTAQAAAVRAKYLSMAGKSESQEGLTYLTGKDDDIRSLADTIGFGYRQNFGTDIGKAGKFAHSAGIFICTPDGHLSQTLQGLNWPTDSLHYALLQAADFKIGSGFLETVAIPCGAVHLGPHGYENNKWFWAGTAGAGATILAVGMFLGVMWHGEWKRKRSPLKPAVSNGGADGLTKAS